ncbi:MAG: flagellar hook assembly protein FlgD [Gammaproteobacteria bacterium]|nr:flagellar hook assembly protein FlgD [Gammaproteobacteria bacterium]
MSAINDISSLQSNTNLATQPKSGSKLGQEEFMKLMTTQLQNQDPFEPMDNGEFLSQIAQFGTVNGITDLQKSFSGFAQDMQSNQALQATSMIGHGVLAETDTGQLTNTGIMQGAVELASYSSNVAVNIYDMTGQVVNRLDLGEQLSGTVPFSWDGSTFSGSRAAPGQYKIEMEVLEGAQTYVYPTLLYGNVNSLNLGKTGEEMQVDVHGLGQLPFSQISKIL